MRKERCLPNTVNVWAGMEGGEVSAYTPPFGELEAMTNHLSARAS